MLLLDQDRVPGPLGFIENHNVLRRDSRLLPQRVLFQVGLDSIHEDLFFALWTLQSMPQNPNEWSIAGEKHCGGTGRPTLRADNEVLKRAVMNELQSGESLAGSGDDSKEHKVS